MSLSFAKGMSHGIPICLGYLSVSFGFGLLAVRSGLSVFQSAAISATSLTSAGQVGGVEIIKAGGTLLEMVLVQLTINIRYSLMALSLSQKLDKRFTFPHRLAASYGITDEIFAVCSAQKERITPSYMYGMILVAFLGWVCGTIMGAAAGSLLPEAVTAAGMTVTGGRHYGMFLAIIVPPAKKQKSVLAAVVIAAAVSIIFHYILTQVSGGFAVMISAIIASVIAALLFPVEDEEEET